MSNMQQAAVLINETKWNLHFRKQKKTILVGAIKRKLFKRKTENEESLTKIHNWTEIPEMNNVKYFNAQFAIFNARFTFLDIVFFSLKRLTYISCRGPKVVFYVMHVKGQLLGLFLVLTWKVRALTSPVLGMWDIQRVTHFPKGVWEGQGNTHACFRALTSFCERCVKYNYLSSMRVVWENKRNSKGIDLSSLRDVYIRELVNYVLGHWPNSVRDV